MERIPILRVGNILLLSIQVELHDSLVQQIQSDVLGALEKEPAAGLVVDISSVEILDTYTARALAQLAQMSGLMGSRTILTGMRPAIAFTLTEMGFNATGFRTALDVDQAITMLNRQASKRRRPAAPNRANA